MMKDDLDVLGSTVFKSIRLRIFSGCMSLDTLNVSAFRSSVTHRIIDLSATCDGKAFLCSMYMF